MEMMVVLLIVAIVAAATAPMVTKKMARNAGSGDSPWVFTGLGGNIAYNMGGNDNTTVLIGTTSVPNGWAGRARLFVDSGNNAAHIAFGNGNQTPLLLTADPAGRVGLSNAQIPSNSVAFGTGQTIANSATGSVIIGTFASGVNQRAIAIGTRSNLGLTNPNTTAGLDSIAIGTAARAAGTRSIAIGAAFQTSGAIPSQAMVNSNSENSIAIGPASYAAGDNAVALGRGAWVNNNTSSQTNNKINNATAIGVRSTAANTASIAIGFNSLASGENSIAIGSSASATGTQSMALGASATATRDNQIVLGTENDTVFIPGHLVAQDVVATRGLYFVDTISPDHRGLQLLDQWRNPDGRYCAGVNRAVATPSWLNGYTLSGVSDRRLKNVGEKYTAGLDELKKLEFFHYTFKKDENKTPMVGVMAQDLQKVFPDAVTKGDDGYLRIRLEDMFYAVINAVKELDSKISQIVENVNNINSKIEEQQKVIDAQQNRIDELEKQNADFEKRLAKLEKKLEKKNKIVE